MRSQVLPGKSIVHAGEQAVNESAFIVAGRFWAIRGPVERP